LNDVVRFKGYVSHEQSIQHLLQADALLLILGPGRESETIYPGKLFEYLAAKRPILALIGEGPTSKLIRKANAGEIIDPVNTDEIKQKLLKFYYQYYHKIIAFSPNVKLIKQFSRLHLTKQLIDIMNEVMNER